jgi:DNA-binding transcriptional MerR regulator
MAKSADAFRTISEVAEILSVPAHVLRFWESRFTQVKPVKRAGGRRYYRPGDIRLLSGIRLLLHEDGMTIKGVQKILREHGVQHVANMAPGTSDLPEGSAPAPSGAAVLDFKRPGDTHETPGAQNDQDVEETVSGPPTEAAAQEQTAAPDQLVEPAGPDAPDPTEASPVEVEDPGPTAAAPPLPALPDLPENPSDTVQASPGSLAALAGLHGPVGSDLAARLAAIAKRLSDLRADRHDPGAATGAAAD